MNEKQQGRGLAALVLAAGALGALAAPTGALAESPVPGSTISCRPVAITAAHGRVARNDRLTAIRHGRVLAVDAATGANANLAFHGRWVTTADGRRMAIAGQELRRAGRTYVVAMRRRRDHTVPCVSLPARAHASDTASYGTDETLMPYGITEAGASTRNASGKPIAGYQSRVVCTGTDHHPDGAVIYSHPTATVWCYKGSSAWLPSPDGRDRDDMSAYDVHYECIHATGPWTQHYITYNAATVVAQKRPSAKPNGEIILGSAIAWRPVNTNLHYPAGFNPEANRVVPVLPPHTGTHYVMNDGTEGWMFDTYQQPRCEI
jgi:hypothetical protein